MKRIATFIITLTAIFLAFLPTCWAQGEPYGAKIPCSSSAKSSPTLRGFRLGMSLVDVNNLIPGNTNFRGVTSASNGYLGELGDHSVSIVFVPDEAAIVTIKGNVIGQGDRNEKRDLIEFAPGNYAFRRSAFRGLDTLSIVSFVLYQGRLTSMKFEYEPTPIYKDRFEFAKTVAPTLGVSGDWSPDAYERAFITCGSFGISVRAGHERVIEVWDTGAQATIARVKREKIDAERKQAEAKDAIFRP